MEYFTALTRQFVISCLLLSCIQFAWANDGTLMSVDTSAGKPRWEAGVFTAAFRGPIYPAAKDYQNKFLPIPFAIYRGEKIRLGDESIVKAIAVEKERFKLDVSLGGAFNADSDKSKIREGMPDLDVMMEVGPKASFLLDSGAADETWLNLQFRSVFSTDFESVEHRGYLFQPEIAFRRDNVFFDNSRFFLSFSSIWATKETHQYFYDVEQQYVTEQRGFYESSAGYLGSKFSIANRVNISPKFLIMFGVQFGLWQGAENEDSPLYQDDFTYAAILGFKWTLMQSDKRIN
ncbi:MipA/OmpV family protein [Thalassotalea crassostreae]|uniref:MipA/OmpV family protein n=1 Tax=Thalassotalea crassostreae TaxID=1763536 RepID=UPI0009EEE8DC|nr:MipA/OmpV family protein [Thalassotalea crassostreae]